LEQNELRRECAAATVVKVDDRVPVVDIKDGPGAEARMNDTVAFVP
jgi:hypothetical protein